MKVTQSIVEIEKSIATAEVVRVRQPSRIQPWRDTAVKEYSCEGYKSIATAEAVRVR